MSRNSLQNPCLLEPRTLWLFSFLPDLGYYRKNERSRDFVHLRKSIIFRFQICNCRLPNGRSYGMIGSSGEATITISPTKLLDLPALVQRLREQMPQILDAHPIQLAYLYGSAAADSTTPPGLSQSRHTCHCERSEAISFRHLGIASGQKPPLAMTQRDFGIALVAGQPLTVAGQLDLELEVQVGLAHRAGIRNADVHLMDRARYLLRASVPVSYPATSQRVPLLPCIVVKYLHSIQRIIPQVFSNQRELLQNIVHHGDHVAADGIRLKDVREFAGACPNQFARRLTAGFNRSHHAQPRPRAGHQF